MILHGKNACQKKPVLNKLVPSISATDKGNDKHFITRSFLEMSALVLLAMSMKGNKKSTNFPICLTALAISEGPC